MSTVVAPETCPRCGRRFEGGKVKVDFEHCDCPGAQYGGHLRWWCLRCGWRLAPGHDPAGEYVDPGAIRAKD